jgi:ubiquinone/menaquinone biosynthesis C-methylase UbiE
MNVKEIQEGRIYEDLAFLVPLISPPEEYGEEASHWRTVLREKLGEDRQEILELGVGGGYNLSHLTGDYQATAVDLSETMLTECRRLNPDITLHRGDMRNVRLKRKFAAVLIHDAISYMLSEADLSAAFQTAAVHLNPKGILITSPDRFLETFETPAIEHATHSAGDLQVTYLEYTHDLDPGDHVVESIMIYFIQSKGSLRIELDRHTTGVFPKETWIRLMNDAGFSTETRSFRLSTMDHPYDLLVGTLR